jgi:hypothetical protein
MQMTIRIQHTTNVAKRGNWNEVSGDSLVRKYSSAIPCHSEERITFSRSLWLKWREYKTTTFFFEFIIIIATTNSNKSYQFKSSQKLKWLCKFFITELLLLESTLAFHSYRDIDITWNKASKSTKSNVTKLKIGNPACGKFDWRKPIPHQKYKRYWKMLIFQM